MYELCSLQSFRRILPSGLMNKDKQGFDAKKKKVTKLISELKSPEIHPETCCKPFRAIIVPSAFLCNAESKPLQTVPSGIAVKTPILYEQ